MRFVGLLLALSSCGASRDPSPPPPFTPPPAVVEPAPTPAVVAIPPTTVAAPPAPASAMDGDLEWRMVAPTTITMAERAGWTLTLEATNRGTGRADAMHGFSSFTVNGAPDMGLDMAFGNGISPTSWAALAPGETANPARSGMGESLFPAPGDYQIVMTRGAAVVGLMVHVLPPRGPSMPAVTP